MSAFNQLLVVAGAAVVALTLREVFTDLFRPSDSGALSDWVGRTMFRLLRRTPRHLPLAGPLSVVLVIGIWVSLLAVGFATIYYTAFPEDFRTSSGAIPSGEAGFRTCLYFSAEALVTFGFGDLVPKSIPLRFVAAAEGLIGFGLLTASVSSIVLLFPAFSRMRLLALSVRHVVEAERATGLSSVGVGSDSILVGLAAQATRTRIDLVHFPIAYYFSPRDAHASIAYWTGDLVRLARDGSDPSRPPQVRLAAAALDRALDDLAAVVARRLPDRVPKDRDAVFRALAEHHLVHQR